MIRIRGWIPILIFCLSAPAQANPLALIRTPLGNLDVELLRDQRPETVANFIRYVDSGRYRQTFFHRLQSNFLAAAGCYTATNRGTIDAAYAPISSFKPIANETTRGGIITNVFGTMSLGQVGGESNRLGSEFFFSLSDNYGNFLTQNQGGYPVFGRVRRGLDVLLAMNTFKPLFEVRVATNALISIFDENLPDYLFGSAVFPVLLFNPRFEVEQQLETLLYLDITLLRAAVKPIPGGARIEWNGVPGRPNVVEFTREFPPTWEVLRRVAGTDGLMAADDLSGEPHRFHRVRIEY